MSSTYNATPDNIVSPGLLVITGVTNTLNPTITTSTSLPLAFLPGVKVNINNVQGAVGVNGIRTVTAINQVAGTFTVSCPAPGVFVNPGGLTPVAVPLYLEAITIPGDGDPEAAASVNTSIESLADQAGLIALVTGQQKITYHIAVSGDNDFGPFSTIASGSAGTWLSWDSNLPQPLIVGGAGGHAVPVQVGDVVTMRFDGNFGIRTAAEDQNAYLHALFVANYVPGGTPTFVRLAGSGTEVFMQPSPDFLYITPISLKGVFTATVAGYFDFIPQVKANLNNLSGSGLSLYSSYSAEVTVLRATGISQ